MIELPIPKQAFADCGAILGRRGAGKSGTGRGILEHELDSGHRCCVIDPKGDWWGIRATKDGEPSRFEIPVFGGSHADVQIDDTMGAALGTIVATTSTSCVIDLSGFSGAGMNRFMTAFADQLFFNNRQPLTLFVDEADQLAPQRVQGDQAKLLHNMEKLIRQGRQRGIFMWMLTQRPAVINKNLLSQAETLIAMKMTTPHDRKAIREWMDAHDPMKAAEVEADLAKLSVGQAWAWVPGQDFLERVQFPMFDSYDSGRTPRHGEIVGDVELKPMDVSGLSSLLNGEDGDDVDTDALELARLEIERLRRRLETLQARAERAELERDTAIATLSRAQDVIGMAIGSPRMQPLPPGVDPTGWIMALDGHDDARPLNAPTAHLAAAKAGVRRMRDAIMADSGTALDPDQAMVKGGQILEGLGAAAHRVLESLQPAQRKIVQAIAAAGGAPLPRPEIARLAGISPTSSNVGAKLTALSGNGLIELGAGDLFRFVGHKS